MTLIELFPWLFAICVAVLTGTLLTRSGQAGTSVWVLAVGAGIASFALYWLAMKWVATCFERRRTRNEKWEREHRQYRDFDLSKTYPAEQNLFYECSVCGNAIPSTPRNNVCCACQNIAVDVKSRRIEIRDVAKVRLFSLAQP